MKVIIAGSRNITDPRVVEEAVREAGFPITEVVSGCARGVDTLGEKFAEQYCIPVKKFPAQWSRYGKGAGPIRNKEMAIYSEALIAIPSPESKGTVNMIATARKLHLKVYVHYIK